MSKLAIITVTINPSIIADLLKSIEKQNDKDFHVYVVDISQSEVPLLYDRTKVVTVLSAENKGYAHSVNIGLKNALQDGYSLFCIINDDTYFEKDFVKSAKKSLALYPRSLIGGKIYYAPGHEYHKDRYDKKDLGRVLWYAGGDVDWEHSQTKHRGVDEIDRKQFDSTGETEFITGCLMLFDKEIIERIGFWDESYFLYFEDADYCERAKRKGVKLYYDPSLVVWHKVSQSTGGSGSSLHVKYQRKNLVRFALRYAPFRTKLHILKNYFLNLLR